MLVNSCNKDLDRVRASVSRKSSVAWSQEEGKHAVSRFRRAVSMKIVIKDKTRCNITAEFERSKIASKSRAVDEKSL